MTSGRSLAAFLIIACCASLGGQTTKNTTSTARTNSAQSEVCPFDTIDRYINCEVMEVLKKQQVGQNGKGNDRQKESPSTDDRSTSLVDQSSATDFVSVAASLIPVGPSFSQSGSSGTSTSSQTGTGGGTATASLYALLAAFNGFHSPTDPGFYKDHVNARRFSFTIGTAASTQATDNTTTPSTVYGAKCLIINKRDLYAGKNPDLIGDVQKALTAETVKETQLATRISEIMCVALHPDCRANNALSNTGVMLASPGKGYKAGEILTVLGSGSGGTVKVLRVDSDTGAVLQLIPITSGSRYSLDVNVATTGEQGQGATVNITNLGSIDMAVFNSFNGTQLTSDNIQATVKVLPSEAKKEIDAALENSTQPFVSLQTKLNEVYDEINKGMQMSISATANTRTGQGNNNYRGEFIFDYGLTTYNRINWTVNGSFDYTDRKTALDSRGGRFATSFQGNLTNPTGGWSKDPLTLVLSGEGDWRSLQKPQYSFDVKLSVPITSGFNFPVDYRYANRAAQINQADSQLRMGLTVDISRIAQALK